MDKKIFIGTSGFSYKHWRGVFYPEGLPTEEWFEYYSKHFDTVEINSSFYRLPSTETFKNWRKRTQKNFIFSVKVSRFITHIKRLKDAREPTRRFLKHASFLREKLGPVLFQLPPSLKLDLKLLSNFIKSLPKNLKFAFEFRNNSWFDKKVYALLDKEGKGFCVHDMRGLSCPRLMMGELAYIRFHGTNSLYAGKYSKSQLKDWAVFIKKCRGKGEVYVYFNNDAEGYAVKNALELKEIIGR